MKSSRIFSSIRHLIAVFSLVAAIAVLMLGQATAQEGNNAVYGTPSTRTSSSSYTDASAFCGGSGCSSADFCAVVNSALSTVITAGQNPVIDARGINSGGSNSCAGSPFTSITTPSTILLPSGIIKISTTWTLPGGTRVIGEGPGQTTILNNGVTTAMITFCSASCNGVVVEDLTLDGGAGNTVNFAGILNNNAQEQSYARNIVLYRIVGAGIRVTTGGSNSGPYVNIKYDAGDLATMATITHCVDVESATTRGFHGLNCLSENATKPNAAILLNGSNNTFEDVHIDGFLDGFKIGSINPATGNVLLSVSGSDVNSLSPNSMVHITNTMTSGVANVSDLAILGATNSATTTLKTIQDDLTSTNLSDPSIALYALGEAVKNSSGTTTYGYSRYTSSPHTASWAIGASTPTLGSGCNTGSLFSVTGTSPYWYVCTGTGTSSAWSPVP